MPCAAFFLLFSGILFGCAARIPEGAEMAAGTNRAFAHTVVTAAPPEAVWVLWTDVAGWPAWDTELEGATLDGPFQEGARGRLSPTSGPTASFRIEAVDPGRAYTVATRLPFGTLRVRRSMAPVGVEGIAVTHAVSFHGLGGRLLSGRFGPRYRRALPEAMARLVALAETNVQP